MAQQNYSSAFANGISLSILLAIIGFIVSYASASYANVPYLQILSAYNVSGYIFAVSILIFAFAIGKIVSGYFESNPLVLSSHPVTQFARYLLVALTYVIGIVAAFHLMGFQISNILVGSAVGGVILGLAIQSITPVILSGVMVASSKTLTNGGTYVIKSLLLGSESPLLCKVKKIGFLYTDLMTTYGIVERVPNTMLLSNSTFSRIKFGDEYRYQTDVIGPSNTKKDSQEIMENVKNYFRSKDNKKKYKVPEIYFSQKLNGYNVFSCVLHFNDINEFNDLISTINTLFDREFKA